MRSSAASPEPNPGNRPDLADLADRTPAESELAVALDIVEAERLCHLGWMRPS